MQGDDGSVLARAFRILGAFDSSSKSLTLTSLSQRTGLPKSSVLRLSRKLVELGALERREDGAFVIGLGLLETASLAPRGHGLRSVALPYMEDLHRIFRQHILLAVLEGTQAVLVERLSARDATEIIHRIGGRLPLMATGVGRVLLAHGPAALQEEILASGPGAWDVPDCRTEPEFRAMMADIRRQGFAVTSREGPEPEPLTSVAAPVTADGDVVAAVSVVAPTGLVDLRAWKVAVMTVARGISRDLDTSPRRRSPLWNSDQRTG